MDFSVFGEFFLYVWEMIRVFFTNGFITLYIVAKNQFIIFLGVLAVVFLIFQENQFIAEKNTKIKKRLM